MSTLFFYGTLMHLPVLSIALGREILSTDCETANLHGFTVFSVKDQNFPVILANDGTVRGLILRDLSQDDMARLSFYEGELDYALKTVTVSTATGEDTAQVFVPRDGRFEAVGPWDFDKWVSDHSEQTCFAAQEIMDYYGQCSAEELDFRLPMINVRAAQKVMARRENRAYSPSGMTAADAELRGVQRAFTGFFAVEEYDLQFRQYDGTQSAATKREVFVASDAAILLPYDPIRDRVMLIEQFRPGPFARNDDKPWMLEPIAGRVDPGELPEDTARREAQEEAGLDINQLHKVGQCYASPGCTSEYFFMYVAEADLPDTAAGIAGLDSEAEDIKSYILSFDELMELVDTMQAVNAPLVLVALWLARHRDRIRAATSR